MTANRYDIVTFDCYGTLIDWRSGMRAAFAAAGLDGDAAVEAYGDVEVAVEQERYRPYREVLALTARRVGEKLGKPIADGSFLANSLPSWQPFADTNPALERLQRGGIRLGLLSNIDDDLLRETRKHFTVDFDVIVTAQQVRSYKPGEAHFITARGRIGNARWLHAAQSNLHDIVPANALGIDSAWVNRHGQKALPGGNPKWEFRNLTELADALLRS
jgi:2-haloalkanoic acid dehalogenase type II